MSGGAGQIAKVGHKSADRTGELPAAPRSFIGSRDGILKLLAQKVLKFRCPFLSNEASLRP